MDCELLMSLDMQTEKKRVLHLLWDGNLGGVQRYVLRVVGAPYWKNVQHGICFFAQPGQVLNAASLPHVRCWNLGLKRGWDVWNARRLDEVVAEFDPQVLHCHCDTPAFALRSGRFAARRLIYTEHGDTIMRTERSWFTAWLWQRSGKRYDAILLNSEFVRGDFLARYPALKEKCIVFPNPLIETYDGPRTADPALPRVGVFGRLVRQKGMDWMLRVAEILCREEPRVSVEFFGDGPLRKELEAQRDDIVLRQPNARIVFHGFVPNPLQRMAEMTCTAVPSRIEPFGLVALEAQGVGVPVVGFTQSGVAEIVVDGVTGSIVPHGDLTAMKNALLRILRDPKMAGEMGRAAWQRARDVFSLERHVERLEKLYGGGKNQTDSV